MTTSREISILLDNLNRAFDRKSWHGTNLRGSIRGLGVAEAAWRPGEGRHNIWELVIHTAYWKYAVRRRLLREKRGMFVHKGSNWFSVTSANEDRWKSDVALLVDEHEKLRATIEAFDPKELTKVYSGSTPNDQVILGIAAHDLYHAGQIQLLKRLRR